MDTVGNAQISEGRVKVIPLVPQLEPTATGFRIILPKGFAHYRAIHPTGSASDYNGPDPLAAMNALSNLLTVENFIITAFTITEDADNVTMVATPKSGPGGTFDLLDETRMDSFFVLQSSLTVPIDVPPGIPAPITIWTTYRFQDYLTGELLPASYYIENVNPFVVLFIADDNFQGGVYPTYNFGKEATLYSDNIYHDVFTYSTSMDLFQVLNQNLIITEPMLLKGRVPVTVGSDLQGLEENMMIYILEWPNLYRA